jgi:hypothetical protein
VVWGPARRVLLGRVLARVPVCMWTVLSAYKRDVPASLVSARLFLFPLLRFDCILPHLHAYLSLSSHSAPVAYVQSTSNGHLSHRTSPLSTVSPPCLSCLDIHPNIQHPPSSAPLQATSRNLLQPLLRAITSIKLLSTRRGWLRNPPSACQATTPCPPICRMDKEPLSAPLARRSRNWRKPANRQLGTTDA